MVEIIIKVRSLACRIDCKRSRDYVVQCQRPKKRRVPAEHRWLTLLLPEPDSNPSTAALNGTFDQQCLLGSWQTTCGGV